MRFETAVNIVLKEEGGYVNDSRDRGGETNYGITHKIYSLYYSGSIRNLTVSQAKGIYRDGYWDVIKGNSLPSGIDLIVFDYAVNSGPIRAIKLLQRLLGAETDGFVGPITLAAADALSQEDRITFIKKFQVYRLNFLSALPSFKIFGKGWTRRVERIRKAALLSASESSAMSFWETITALFDAIFMLLFLGKRK